MDRLRQRADFLAAAQGPRMNSPGFVVQNRRRDDDGPVRVGFTVTKKVGNAPERNRVRRRLRAVLRQADPGAMAAHSDYVIVARRAALSRDFADLRNDLAGALRRLGKSPGARP
jgi:ribonuclease P protein component